MMFQLGVTERVQFNSLTALQKSQDDSIGISKLEVHIVH